MSTASPQASDDTMWNFYVRLWAIIHLAKHSTIGKKKIIWGDCDCTDKQLWDDMVSYMEKQVRA